jgi:hypothetical protein
MDSFGIPLRHILCGCQDSRISRGPQIIYRRQLIKCLILNTLHTRINTERPFYIHTTGFIILVIITITSGRDKISVMVRMATQPNTPMTYFVGVAGMAYIHN